MPADELPGDYHPAVSAIQIMWQAGRIVKGSSGASPEAWEGRQQVPFAVDVVGLLPSFPSKAPAPQQ